MRYWRFLVVIFLFVFGRIVAQDNYSESFFNPAKNIHLHLPSIACAENDFEGIVGYRTYTNKLSVVRSYYADANFNLRSKKKSSHEHSKHVAGIGFYNDKEGEFFTKARILSRYGVHIPLSEELTFSGGMAFHLINYIFNASGAGASGSAWAWAGGVSSSIYSSSFKLGIALNDINSPNVRPINYAFSVPRYLTFYGEKQFELGPNAKLKGSSRLNFKSKMPVSYIAQLGFVFTNTLALGGFYYANKGTGMYFDLDNIKLYDGKLDVSLAYLLPGKNVNPAVSQYEINLKYSIDR